MVAILVILRKLIVPVFLFLVFPVQAEPASLDIHKIRGDGYVYLDDLVRSFQIETSFDIITQKGKLYYKTHYAVFTIPHDFIIVDGSIFRSVSAVIRMRGAVMLPVDAAVALLGSFYPEYSFAIQGKEIRSEKKQQSARNDVQVKTQRKQGPQDRITFIVVDAGHGGKDPGAVGKGGMLEKAVTLKVAQLIEDNLKKSLSGIKIIMTRKKDTFIELSKRTDVANSQLSQKNNGLFLSIHVNATLSPVISGYETYYLSQNPSNDEARNTAALENNVIVLEDDARAKKRYDDIDYIEATMLTTQIQKESMLFAECVQKGMEKRVAGTKSRGIKSADFFVLRGVLMPAVLVEIGFITNKKEAASLKSLSHQKRIASGVSEGIINFIRKYNAMIQ